MKTSIVATLVCLLGLLGLVGSAGPAGASPPARTSTTGSIPAPPGLTSTDVSFEGFGGLTLHGTVLAPAKAPGTDTGTATPGVVLVTGSGAGVPREHLLAEATAFARQGIATLIYDKRSAGYTLFRRSYSELATDALGAVDALRARPGVDPARVGVWGLSEGGWVAPLAASRSGKVAFVIVVGGNAMSPIRQQLWNETSTLRGAGVSGSLVDHAKPNFIRLGADAGLFAEAYYDAPGVLARVRQPLLGIWGSGDQQTPPKDNPPLFAKALEQGGNTHYAFRVFADADHAAHVSPDGGITRGEDLAPGYADLVGSWVRAGGRITPAGASARPNQPYPSAEVRPSAWWEGRWMQLAVFGLFVVAFLAYPLVALVRRLRGRKVHLVSRWARLLAAAGLACALGVLFYLFYLMAAGRTPDPGPIVAGRPLPWLALQGFAVAAIAAGIATVVAWRRASGAVSRGERARLGVLVAAGVVFVPWAFYWGLLLP